MRGNTRATSRLQALAGCWMALVLAGCLPGDGDGEEGDDDASQSSESVEESREPERLVGTTALHNDVRANVSPAASPPLEPLVWDAALAAAAQAYADRCVYTHSSNARLGNYGENLYGGAGRQASPADVVGAWGGEAKDYDLATGNCSGKCGHYTAIVWRDTARVGCGVATCKTGSPFAGFTEWEFWVCNYDPPGNWQGEKPY